ncbi:MAG: hypothetical protein QXU02_00485 [Candidatus Bathyarchaeia archaeon]
MEFKYEEFFCTGFGIPHPPYWAYGYLLPIKNIKFLAKKGARKCAKKMKGGEG